MYSFVYKGVRMGEDHVVLYRREDGYYYYYFYRYGRRIRRSTGTKRKGRALAIVDERKALGDLLNETARILPPTFREFAQPFWIFDTCPILTDRILRGGHFSKGLADTNRRNVIKYLIPTFGDKFLPEITPSMVNRWLLSLPAKHKITPQTANKQLTMLRQMLDVAVSENQISDNPARKVKPLVPKPGTKGCFTKDQITALFASAWPDYVVELACRLSALTGMRLGEIRALQQDQLQDDAIEVSRSFSDTDKLKCTKSGKSRLVPVPHWLYLRLLSIPNNGPYVLSYTGEKPMSSDNIRDKLKIQMDKAGIDYKSLNLSFHSFRHYVNTRLKAAGIDGELTRAVIGHSSEKMTEHYLHLSPSDMDRIRTVQDAI